MNVALHEPATPLWSLIAKHFVVYGGRALAEGVYGTCIFVWGSPSKELFINEPLETPSIFILPLSMVLRGR